MLYYLLIISLLDLIFLSAYITTSYITNFSTAEINVSIISKLGWLFFIGKVTKSDCIFCLLMISLHQLMYYDFSSCLENNLPIKFCKNCHTPLIPKGRVDSLYCDKIMAGFKVKCAAVGAYL